RAEGAGCRGATARGAVDGPRSRARRASIGDTPAPRSPRGDIAGARRALTAGPTLPPAGRPPRPRQLDFARPDALDERERLAGRVRRFDLGLVNQLADERRRAADDQRAQIR